MKNKFWNKQLSEDLTLVELYDENKTKCGTVNGQCDDIACNVEVNVGVGGLC